MTCPCQTASTAIADETDAPDRYVSFIGLDCDAKAERLMEFIRRHIDDPAQSNAFWEYFKKKAAGGSGPRPDALFLIHCNLNQIRELFEERSDEEALVLLDRIEQECC